MSPASRSKNYCSRSLSLSPGLVGGPLPRSFRARRLCLNARMAHAYHLERGARDLKFSATCEERFLALGLEMTIATQSRAGKDEGGGEFSETRLLRLYRVEKFHPTFPQQYNHQESEKLLTRRQCNAEQSCSIAGIDGLPIGNAQI